MATEPRHSESTPRASCALVFVRGLDQSREEQPSESVDECLRGLVAAAARQGRTVSWLKSEKSHRRHVTLKWRDGDQECEAPVYEVNHPAVLRAMWRRRSTLSRAIVSAIFAAKSLWKGLRQNWHYSKTRIIARLYNETLSQELDQATKRQIKDYLEATRQRTKAFFWYSFLFLAQITLATLTAVGLFLAPLMGWLFRMSPDPAWLTVLVAVAISTVVAYDKLWLYANVLVPAGLYISRRYGQHEVAAEYAAVLAEATEDERSFVLVGFSMGAFVALRSHKNEVSPRVFLSVGAPIAFVSVLFADGADYVDRRVRELGWKWLNFYDRIDLCGSQTLLASANREIASTFYPVGRETEKLLWHHEAHNSYWYHHDFTNELCNAMFRRTGGKD